MTLALPSHRRMQPIWALTFLPFSFGRFFSELSYGISGIICALLTLIFCTAIAHARSIGTSIPHRVIASEELKAEGGDSGQNAASTAEHGGFFSIRRHFTFSSLLSAEIEKGQSHEVHSGGSLLVISDNANSTKAGDCTIRFLEFMRELDSILASAPKAIDPIYAAFQKFFPIQSCNIEEILAIARKSRFFVGSEETPAFYNISLNSAGAGPGNGFGVLISLNKKTRNLEKPFAKVNGF